MSLLTEPIPKNVGQKKAPISSEDRKAEQHHAETIITSLRGTTRVVREDNRRLLGRREMLQKIIKGAAATAVTGAAANAVTGGEGSLAILERVANTLKDLQRVGETINKLRSKTAIDSEDKKLPASIENPDAKKAEQEDIRKELENIQRREQQEKAHKEMLMRYPEATPLERKVSETLRSVVDGYYVEISVDGKTNRVPVSFGEYGESLITLVGEQKKKNQTHFGSKGTPEEIVPIVKEFIRSGAFHKYLQEVKKKHPKLLEQWQQVAPNLGKEQIEKILYAKIFRDHGISVDCIGFVNAALSKAYKQFSLNYDALVRSRLGWGHLKGPTTLYFDVAHLEDKRLAIPVENRVTSLKPGDVFTIYGATDDKKQSRPVHSMIVVGVNMKQGEVVLAQSTDIGINYQQATVGPSYVTMRVSIGKDPSQIGIDKLETDTVMWGGIREAAQMPESQPDDPSVRGRIGNSYAERFKNFKIFRLKDIDEQYKKEKNVTASSR